MQTNTERRATEVKTGQEPPSFELYKTVAEYLFEVTLADLQEPDRFLTAFSFFSMGENRL